MKNRNYGIDLLRILAMGMIVVLHLLSSSGLLVQVQRYSNRYWMVWTMEMAAYCAVNCYGLISGYVMQRSRFQPSKAAGLWLQTLFYSLAAGAVILALHPASRTRENLVNILFPVTRGQYWYISAYLGMYILTPALNAALEHCSRQCMRRMLLGVFVMMCLMPTALQTDPYHLNYGYGIMWLCILYLAGGYMGRYGVLEHGSKGIFALGYLGALALIMVSFRFPEYFDIRLLLQQPTDGRPLMAYTSPAVIVMAVCLLGLCSKLRFAPLAQRCIAWAAPATLGVYLLHNHPLVFSYVLPGLLQPLLGSRSLILGIGVLAGAVGVLVCGIVVEKLRQGLFRVTGIAKLCGRLDRLAQPQEGKEGDRQ